MAHNGNIITFKATLFHFSMDLVRNFFSDVPLSHLRGFLGSSVGKESACNSEDLGSIPRSRRSAGEGIGYTLQYPWASLVAQLVKNLPAIWETWLRPLGWEDPLEKGKATHFQDCGLENSMDCMVSLCVAESGTTERLSLPLHRAQHLHLVS